MDCILKIYQIKQSHFSDIDLFFFKLKIQIPFDLKI